MNEKELRGRLQDIQKRLKRIEAKDYGITFLQMFIIALMCKSCH